ncbi:MAG: methyltransferase domain-containing protein [Telmatospirillum sp.]|nr:methyltransferase domain-containing protein [Telmatospirillum sp.]
MRTAPPVREGFEIVGEIRGALSPRNDIGRMERGMADLMEQTGWQIAESGPDAYERYIVPAWMGGWARNLVTMAALSPGERVLELACGTGVVSREAGKVLGPAGEVTGVDRDRGMLRAARTYAVAAGLDAIRWSEGDASHIPAASGSFDVVLCQQGLQFFPDRPGALREMARVLRPGGRVLLSVWRSLDRCPVLSAVCGALGRRFGARAEGVFHASCSLHDPDTLRSLLAGAGFDGIHIRLEARMARHPSLQTFLSGYLSVFPMAAEIAALDDSDRASLFDGIIAELGPYRDDDGLAAPMEAYVVAAHRGTGRRREAGT